VAVCACFAATKLDREIPRNHGERNSRRLNPTGVRFRERAVLTLRCARLVSWSARLGAAATLSVLTWSAVHADGMAVGGCIGSRYSINCAARWGSYSDPYIRVLHPETEAEKALAAERDHKWQARCRPAVFQDHYGVPRYEYAAPGCEFGVIE
jgi:hypothetical protein